MMGRFGTAGLIGPPGLTTGPTAKATARSENRMRVVAIIISEK